MPDNPMTAEEPRSPYWVIWFEDHEMKHEVFTSEEAARARHAAVALSWNVRLFAEEIVLAALQAQLDAANALAGEYKKALETVDSMCRAAAAIEVEAYAAGSLHPEFEPKIKRALKLWHQAEDIRNAALALLPAEALAQEREREERVKALVEAAEGMKMAITQDGAHHLTVGERIVSHYQAGIAYEIGENNLKIAIHTVNRMIGEAMDNAARDGVEGKG